MGEGIGWAIFGGLITAISYSAAADGGTYVIASGAMIVGGIQFALGVLQLWFTADFKPGTRFKLLGAMGGIGGASFCVFVGITKNVHPAAIILTAGVALAFGGCLFLIGRHQDAIVNRIITGFRETLLWVIGLKARSKVLLFLVAPVVLFTVSEIASAAIDERKRQQARQQKEVFRRDYHHQVPHIENWVLLDLDEHATINGETTGDWVYSASLSQPGEEVTWQARVRQTGRYAVGIRYSCRQPDAKGILSLSAGDAFLEYGVSARPCHLQHYYVPMGELYLEEGSTILRVGVVGPSVSESTFLYGLRLELIGEDGTAAPRA